MAHNFGSIIFTPVIKALQEKYGSRRQYARLETAHSARDQFGPSETEFIQERDSFYMATLGETGWPYVQHRGGPTGFLKVIDGNTLGFADFRGNKQFITTGNLLADNRAALILVDYPRQARLKILGRVEILEGDRASQWMAQLRDPSYSAVIERAYLIRVEAFDWNCQQHILPRFTGQQMQQALLPFEQRLERLEKENQQLRDRRGQS